MYTALEIIAWFLLIWSSYHLIRDFLQDIMGVHHPLIDIWHKEPRRQLQFISRFHKFWGIPFILGIFLSSAYTIFLNETAFGVIIAIILFIIFITYWIWSSF